MSFIKDGTGDGHRAKVDSDFNLHTLSSNESRMASKSKIDSTAYSIYGRRNFAAGGTDEGLLYFQYTGDNAFFIDKIVIAASAVATAVNLFAAKAEIFVDSTYGSGGTAVTPINMDRASAKTLTSTAYTGASTLTVTKGSNEVIDVRMNNSTEVVEFDGSLILEKNNNIYILGEVVAATDKMRCMILGYEGER